MNRNQARTLHKEKFQSVLDDIDHSYLERFASRYSAYLSQIENEEEARVVFNITSEPQETESYWAIDYWRLITSRTTPAEKRDHTTSLSLGIVYTDNYFLEESAGSLLTFNRERLEEYRIEEEHKQFFSQFLPSWW